MFTPVAIYNTASQSGILQYVEDNEGQIWTWIWKRVIAVWLKCIYLQLRLYNLT